jgi:hypothetical protein
LLLRRRVDLLGQDAALIIQCLNLRGDNPGARQVGRRQELDGERRIAHRSTAFRRGPIAKLMCSAVRFAASAFRHVHQRLKPKALGRLSSSSPSWSR